MKKIIISFLALGCFATINQSSSTITSNLTSKNLKLVDNSEEREEYEEDDYDYDGFLDDVYIESSMENDDENIYFAGRTSANYDGFSFSLNFNIEALNYEADFSDSGIDIFCDRAIVDGYGRLESEIIVNNPESGDAEIYKISNYRDIRELEKFVLNPEETKINTVSTCGLFSNIRKAIAAIVTTYVVVAETAEQIKARYNYRDNKALESEGSGVKKGNYITNQSEESRNGYNSARYKFGFTEFEETGCEVASVYNLMINEGLAQDLSEVIYSFEKWAIEFAVGWGYLGSNPRDIYRYLRKYNIKYTKRSSYSSFRREVINAEDGTRFIMSSWNSNWITGLHTYFFIKTEDHLETYNFIYGDSTYDYNDLDDLYSDTGLFIVGYKIND